MVSHNPRLLTASWRWLFPVLNSDCRLWGKQGGPRAALPPLQFQRVSKGKKATRFFKQTAENLQSEKKYPLPVRNMGRVPAGKGRNGTQILTHILSNLTDHRICLPGSKCQQKKRCKVTSLKRVYYSAGMRQYSQSLMIEATTKLKWLGKYTLPQSHPFLLICLSEMSVLLWK